MKKQAIEMVVFDIGMVLLKFDFDLTVEKLKHQSSVPSQKMAELFWDSGLVDEYDRGKITTEEFALEVSKRIGFKGEISAIIEAWSDIFTPNTLMIEQAKRIKRKGIPIYFLSNTCEAHIEFFTKRHDIFQEFAGGIFSCREGFLKPEATIYERLIQRYNMKPQNTLFIDDLERNVLAAQKLGLSTIHYTQYKKVKQELEKFGL